MIIKETRHATNEGPMKAALFFGSASVNAHTEYRPHKHQWGQIICVKSGIFALDIDGQRFLTPSGFVLWIPCNMQHSSHNHRPTHFRSINIAAKFCATLPATPCILHLTPLSTMIIEDFFSRQVHIPQKMTDLRLARVLIDQLSLAPPQHTYLPTSDDPCLAPILQALEHHPGDLTSLAQWAKIVHISERTLARRCQKALGMTFSEWRQRARFLYALSLLEQGQSIHEIARQVGYSTSSAFIAMFQAMAATSPERYRRQFI